jgi:hypothetical protein
LCDRAAVELKIGLKKWKTTIDRHGTRIFVNCILPESIIQDAVIHFGSLEWAGKVNRNLSNEQLLMEAQRFLGIEGTWNVRSSSVSNDVKNIECERMEVTIDKPDLPKDAEVTFDYGGSRKTVALKMGTTAAQQAKAVQKAFKVTLECGPIEEDGDGYTVQAFKPSVFPVVFSQNGIRTRSWVHNTSTKVVQAEAERLFGSIAPVELLAEPGLVYEVNSIAPRQKAAKKEIEAGVKYAADVRARNSSGRIAIHCISESNPALRNLAAIHGRSRYRCHRRRSGEGPTRNRHSCFTSSEIAEDQGCGSFENSHQRGNRRSNSEAVAC